MLKNRVKETHSKLGNLSLTSQSKTSSSEQTSLAPSEAQDKEKSVKSKKPNSAKNNDPLITPRGNKGTKRRQRSSTVEGSTPKKAKAAPIKEKESKEVKAHLNMSKSCWNQQEAQLKDGRSNGRSGVVRIPGMWASLRFDKIMFLNQEIEISSKMPFLGLFCYLAQSF